MNNSVRLLLVAPLLFSSGLCALAYQVVWLREMRLVFGMSTMATGLVLAVFMAGLGGGAVVIGRYADRARRPLFLYGCLEIGVTMLVLASPFLTIVISKLYIATGGGAALGLLPATLIRILLSVLILLPPTFLMGGTLPAAARFAETAGDSGRRALALLYGVNTLGGVIGVALTTFVLLESLGNRFTLISACLLNGLIGLLALLLARRYDLPRDRFETITVSETSEEVFQAPVGFVYLAAFVAGFSFLLMELVWYRMLAPILGGSTYSFGIILAVALAGIGVGGLLYASRRKEKQTTLPGFMLICGLEAVCIGFPYALGDRIAILATLLQPLANIGFLGQVLGWTAVTALVVLPGAILSGIQFPMLVNLLGKGRNQVGTHTGAVYGWNTAGAITGALTGGFGFIPLFTAPDCWRLVTLLLLLLAIAVLFILLRKKEPVLLSAVQLIFVSLVIALILLAKGPTVAWRHSPIGTTKMNDLSGMGINVIQDWLLSFRRNVIWEKDGLESSVGIYIKDGLSFVVNGKTDGNATGDAGTQVMGPLVGAIHHPKPRKGLVIGLGIGSSAGWLAEVDTMEQVDVIELEPAIIEVARRSAPVNFNVLEHEKVKVIIGDGREILQTAVDTYDVIFSEPSNPYRAGIASLYTQEFYQTVEKRLARGGIFSQWVQAYHVDARTIRIILATLRSVFPNVEVWRTDITDLLFVCSREKITYDSAYLREQVSKEPFKSALDKAWGVNGLEGLLAGFVAGPGLAEMVVEPERKAGRINTDDKTLVEFGFARGAGTPSLFSIADLQKIGKSLALNKPFFQNDDVGWELVEDERLVMLLHNGLDFRGERSDETPDRLNRAYIFHEYQDGNYAGLLSAAQSGKWRLNSSLESAVLAESLAEKGEMNVFQITAGLQTDWPNVADAILARYHWRVGANQEAIQYLTNAFTGFRNNPWQFETIMIHSMNLAIEMAGADNTVAKDLFEALELPFSVYNLEEYRKFALLQIGRYIGFEYGAQALAQWEPHVAWNIKFLEYRAACYRDLGHPLAEKAATELSEFLKNEPVNFIDSFAEQSSD